MHNAKCKSRSLFYGLYEYLFRKDVYHVLILGVDKAGKTNVLERLKTLYTQLVGLDPGKILPTVGLNVGRLEAFSQSMVFWDLGGQSGLRAIWPKYYDESHAVIFVVDSASRERFDESRRALEGVLESIELTGAPLLVMANKQDLPGAADAQEVSGSACGASQGGRALACRRSRRVGKGGMWSSQDNRHAPAVPLITARAACRRAPWWRRGPVAAAVWRRWPRRLA